MLDYIYPEEEQRFFTDREHHLELLGLSRDLLTQGIRKHLALSGFRRVGKTVILKEFLRRHLLPGLDAPVTVAYLDRAVIIDRSFFLLKIPECHKGQLPQIGFLFPEHLLHLTFAPSMDP